MAYNLEGQRWNHTTITWSFATQSFPGQPGGAFSSQISDPIIINDVINAFSQWDNVSGLSFVKVADGSSVDIRLGMGPIDGNAGSTIGITYYSYSGGFFISGVTIRFDSDEGYFTQNGEVYIDNTGNPVRSLALHEIGHALGLDHYNGANAVMNSASGTNVTLQPSDIEGIRALYGAGAAVQISDQTTHVQSSSNGTPYSGPVAGLIYQYINLTSDNLNITGLSPNGFIHTGSGFDAIDVSNVGSINVLDGGTNSNFLVGGTAAGSFDTFFVDNRNPPGDIWSTVVNFHKGDDATVWGVTQAGFKTTFVDGEGAVGFKGLTLHVTKPGVPTASLTLSGYSTADLTNGRLSTTFGTVGGSDYFFVHGNA